MLEKEIKIFIDSCKRGTRHEIIYSREITPSKSGRGHIVVKVSKMNISLGGQYDNQQTIQKARESGVLPTDNQGIKGGRYEVGYFPFLIRYDNGNLALRCSTESLGNIGNQVKWFLDGTEVDKSQLVGILRDSDLKPKKAVTVTDESGKEKSKYTFNVSVKDIISLT